MAGLSQENKLRDAFNPEGVARLGSALQSVWSAFPLEAFQKEALKGLEALSFGERKNQICKALESSLPQDFQEAVSILCQALGPELDNSGITSWEGFMILPQTLYVSRRGQEHLDLSMKALYEMTKRFTAEWDIRPFIEKHENRVMDLLHKWAVDPNPHVRRLVSEGTRPRLPLGSRLKRFQENPDPNFELLEKLKADESPYVLRSVANHLNDISKDHPERVITCLKAWKESENPGTQWAIRHAARGLIKQGNSKALALFGYDSDPEIGIHADLDKSDIVEGESIVLRVNIESKSKRSQVLLIDYVIFFQKSNQTLAPKVFKWMKQTLQPGETRHLKKIQEMKTLSTRKLYPGEHRIEIQINGQRFCNIKFNIKNII